MRRFATRLRLRSFGRSVARVREHYAIDVPVEAVCQLTLRHGKAMTTLSQAPFATPAPTSSPKWTGA